MHPASVPDAADGNRRKCAIGIAVQNIDSAREIHDHHVRMAIALDVEEQQTAYVVGAMIGDAGLERAVAITEKDGGAGAEVPVNHEILVAVAVEVGNKNLAGAAVL